MAYCEVAIATAATAVTATGTTDATAVTAADTAATSTAAIALAAAASAAAVYRSAGSQKTLVHFILYVHVLWHRRRPGTAAAGGAEILNGTRNFAGCLI